MKKQIVKLANLFLIIIFSIALVVAPTKTEAEGDVIDDPVAFVSIFSSMLADWDSSKTVLENINTTTGAVKAARSMVNNDNTTEMVTVLGGKVGIGIDPQDSFLVYINGDLWIANLQTNSVKVESLKVTTNNITFPDKSLDGAVIESETITSTQIKNNTITADDIVNNTITSTQIADNTITSNDIANGTIKTEDIDSGAITGTNIADNSITTNHIVDGTIQKEDFDENVNLDWSMFDTSGLTTDALVKWDGTGMASTDLVDESDAVKVNTLLKLNSYTNTASLPNCNGTILGYLAFNVAEDTVFICSKTGWSPL